MTTSFRHFYQINKRHLFGTKLKCYKKRLKKNNCYNRGKKIIIKYRSQDFHLNQSYPFPILTRMECVFSYEKSLVLINFFNFSYFILILLQLVTDDIVMLLLLYFQANGASSGINFIANRSSHTIHIPVNNISILEKCHIKWTMLSNTANIVFWRMILLKFSMLFNLSGVHFVGSNYLILYLFFNKVEVSFK